MPAWILLLLPATVSIAFVVNRRQRKPITLLRMGTCSCLIVAGLMLNWWNEGSESVIGVYGLTGVIALLAGFVASACLGMYLALRHSGTKTTFFAHGEMK